MDKKNDDTNKAKRMSEAYKTTKSKLDPLIYTSLASLTTDVELMRIDNVINNPASELNKIIARANRSDTLKKKVDKVLEFKKSVVQIIQNRRDKNSNSQHIIHDLYGLENKNNDNYNLYLKYNSEPTEKQYNEFTQNNENINEIINTKSPKFYEDQQTQNETIVAFAQLQGMVNELADDMSGTTKELTLKQIKDKLKELLSEKGRTQTDDIIADATIAAISSSFTLDEVRNGESMGYESNFTNENGKLCGEVPEGGSEVAGEKCLNIIMQCLGEKDPQECLKKWNRIDLSDGISFSNFHKPTAKKLAEHLGLDSKTTDELVTVFNKSIDDYNNARKSDNNFTKREYINNNLKTALEALEKTIEKPVKPDTSIPTIPQIRGNVRTHRYPSVFAHGPSVFAHGPSVLVYGGGSNKNNSSDIAISYANFIRNTHALKNMVSMTGGGFTEINPYTIRLIRKTWGELNKLMGSKGSDFSEKAKKSFLSDLDSLERSVRRIGIIAKYLEIVKEIFEDNSFTAYLKDLKVDSKKMELSIVEKLVKKYNESSKAAGKKFGTITNTLGASSADLAPITKAIDETNKKMTTVEDKVDKLTKTLTERIPSANRIWEPNDSDTMIPTQDNENNSLFFTRTRVPTITNNQQSNTTAKQEVHA